MKEQKIQVRKPMLVVALVVTLIAGAAAGTLFTVEAAGAAPSPALPAQVASSQPTVDATSLAQGFRPVVQKALPAVVNISAERVVETSSMQSPFSNPLFEFFGQGFGNNMPPQQQRENSLGSGVIVSPDGYILTNNHVVENAQEIQIALGDGRELDAKVVGTDPATDIAVVKVDATDLPYLQLGQSGDVQVGDIVLAMGNPFGVGQTVTMGIVSATGRGGLNIEDYEDFIQTDAAINPGNSGGPLVNVAGDVIGINTAILSRTGGNNGVGFAVPSNVAHEVMEQIIDHGEVQRGFLGVNIQNVEPGMAKQFGLSSTKGAIVSSVDPEGPAGKSGVKTGDVIVGVNNEGIDDYSDLQWTIARAGPDTNVDLHVVRDGKDMTLPVTLGERPNTNEQASFERGGSSALTGIRVEDLTPQIARQLDMSPSTTGVVIDAVDPSSPAAEAGLTRGDVIQQVNRRDVSNTSEFNQAVRQAGSGEVLLLVNRGGNTRFVVVEP